RPAERRNTIWLHPGEPVFERFRALVSERLAEQGRRGAVFVDPAAEKPYLFHLALLSVVRKADSALPDLAKEEVLDCRLVGIKQYEGGEMSLCPVEHLLLLKGGRGLPVASQGLAVAANAMKDQDRAFLLEHVAKERARECQNRLLDSLSERESFIQRGFDYQEAELAAARVKHSEKARGGHRKAIEAMEDVKRQQRQLASRRENALSVLRREPETIAPGEVTFVAHALVVPSSDPLDLKQHEANVEAVAMKVAQAFEEAAGATVSDVHTPELARAAGLSDYPGFDLLSIRRVDATSRRVSPSGEDAASTVDATSRRVSPSGEDAASTVDATSRRVSPSGEDAASTLEKRAIEVKGRAGTSDIEVTANEWAKACNMRQGYWLYAVYDCATPNPRLVRVQDPFGNLLAKAKGSVLISAGQIAEAARQTGGGISSA
ncbi:MAG: DUF3883 domain-containing protein, partial [Planctomycetes bacterium]|nr:DUF3883 domain-containing protein [Planctomycetota bacterium]